MDNVRRTGVEIDKVHTGLRWGQSVLSYTASLDLQDFLHEPRIAYLQINYLAQNSCELGQSSLPIYTPFSDALRLGCAFRPHQSCTAAHPTSEHCDKDNQDGAFVNKNISIANIASVPWRSSHSGRRKMRAAKKAFPLRPPFSPLAFFAFPYD